MAAPVLSKKQKAACREKSKKSKLKNVLCGENISRPKPSREIEECIVLKLSDIFKKLPNIFKSLQNASTKDQEAKRKIRVQLDLGTNCVCRSLEMNRLACVLVSGKTSPATAVDHVITLARERGCPLLCLDTLGPTLSRVTKSKAFPVCIGFKMDTGLSDQPSKFTTNAQISDFVDVISLVQQNTSTIKRPPPPVKKGGDKNKNMERTSLPESLRPICLDASTNEAIRGDLKRIFASAALKENDGKMMTSKQKKRKNNRKNRNKTVKEFYLKWLHNQFESGKRTVTEFVGQGKIQFVFVLPELLPVLMSEHPSLSLLCVARDQDCPVMCVSNLSAVMSNDALKAQSVLGIKKESTLPMNQKSVFSPVIEKCLNFMRTVSIPSQDMDFDDDSSFPQPANSIFGDSANTQLLAKTQNKLGEEEKEVEDYSFMYVMKKDSTELKEKAVKLKQEQEAASKQMGFGGDFISLGSSSSSGGGGDNKDGIVLGKRKSKKPLSSVHMAPKKMNLDSQSQADVSSDATSSGFLSFNTTNTKVKKDITEEEGEGGNNNSLFSISRTGAKPNNDKNNTNSSSSSVTKMEEGIQSGATSTTSASTGLVVLGLDPNQAKENEEADHISTVFSAQYSKNKGEDKRRHDQEGFQSFAYTQANIHTMVSNVDRPKNKKTTKKKNRGGKK